MIQNRFAATRPAPSSAVVGLPLACLWALHAAGAYVPAQRYVTVPLLLASAATLVIWRAGSRPFHFGFRNKSWLTIAVASWFVGAALSSISNWNTPQVLLT